MKIITQFLLFLLSTLFAINIFAQNARVGNWCATMEQTEQLQQENPALIQQEIDLKQQVREYIDNNKGVSKKASPWIIPVVVHNITHDDGMGYVSKNEIENQLTTLTNDFKRLNSDASNTRAVFAPYAAAMDIEFRLAHIDPNGNCTEGIVRVDNPLSNFPVPRNSVKGVSYWDSKKYFNIWVIDNIESTSTGGYVAGYAQFPTSGINATYGVVMKASSFGGGERTLTHEVGHCLGLYHTFQSSCGNNCANSGDGICDTPPAYEDTYNCDVNQNTCANDATGPDPYGSNVVDQIENYMSYDNCQNMFSLEQGDAMAFYLNSTSISNGLAQLSANSNLIATGVADPYTPADCVPIAEFNYNKSYICQGDSVQFYDQSYDATPTVYNWQFTGGTPSTSGIENPVITYNTPGVFSVTNQPGTSAGSSSLTKSNIITVSSLAADYSGIIVDGFENSTDFNNQWRIENLDGGSQTFVRTTSAAATGNASVRIQNRFISTEGVKHELISPSYDLSVLSNPTINFKRAFARRSTTNTDRLLVWYSLDCGYSWFLAMPPLSGSNLSSIGSTLQTGNWVPTANDWAIKSRTLAAITNETNVRFKFAFESGLGNNLYLDDINIDGTLSVEEQFKNITGFNVFPNPTSSSAKISFQLVDDVENLTIRVRNAVGQVVTNVINGESFAVGRYTLQIDEDKKLSSGLYFIEFSADDKVQVQKLIVR